MRGPERGFTLIELMVSTVIASVIMASIFGLFLSQNKTYQKHEQFRTMQSNGRTALETMVRALRNAGYGVEPEITFDVLDRDTNTERTMDNVGPAAEAGVACSGCPTNCNPAVTVSAPCSDEIAFHLRRPTFVRKLNAGLEDNLTIESAGGGLPGPLTRPLHAGQSLLLLCPGAVTRAYVHLNAAAAKGATTLSLGTLSWLTWLPNERGRLPPASPDDEPCLEAPGGPTVLLIDRYRFFIAYYDDDGVPETLPRPYLMVERGWDTDGDGVVDVFPVAADIEDLQVTYLMHDGTQLPGAGAAPPRVNNPDPTAEFQALDYNDTLRDGRQPANIRAVRIGVVVRSPRRDLTTDGDPVPPLENRATLLPNDGYRRIVFQSTVIVRNMLSRSQFLPPLTSATDDGLNVGGG